MRRFLTRLFGLDDIEARLAALMAVMDEEREARLRFRIALLHLNRAVEQFEQRISR
jgi:hypothetical protein